MRILRTTTLAALLAGIAATVSSVPAANHAAAAVMKTCPQSEMEYCVRGKDGFKHTAWTNHCFAKESGLHILHKGACKGTGMH